MTAQFDDKGELWVELTDGKLPVQLLHQSEIFLVEHDEPGRLMINLTKYICMLVDARQR